MREWAQERAGGRESVRARERESSSSRMTTYQHTLVESMRARERESGRESMRCSICMRSAPTADRQTGTGKQVKAGAGKTDRQSDRPTDLPAGSLAQVRQLALC